MISTPVCHCGRYASPETGLCGPCDRRETLCCYDDDEDEAPPPDGYEYHYDE
jgi:hypothetical protein